MSRYSQAVFQAEVISSEHVLAKDFWLQPILNLNDWVIPQGRNQLTANHGSKFQAVVDCASVMLPFYNSSYCNRVVLALILIG